MKICSNCGSETDSSWKICQKCGFVLETETAVINPNPEPQQFSESQPNPNYYDKGYKPMNKGVIICLIVGVILFLMMLLPF